jgi:hypothetical protein
MSRLVAFGCSLTYGHGLPDCHVAPHHPGPSVSKLVWPEVVARQLNRKCINMATPGSSNKRIWHNIINFKFKKDDVAIILWSYEERFSILKNKKSVDDIGHWVESNSAVAYYQHLYNSYDASMQTKLYVSHANFLLKEKAISVYNLTTKKETVDIFKLSGQTIPHIPLYICNNYRDDYPKALDNKHPGVECNQVFGNDILQYVVTDKYKKSSSFIERIKCILT